MFIRSTGEPFLAQVVGHSEHGDAYRRIAYDHDGKTVLHDRAYARRLSLGMPCTQCARSVKFWMSANTRTLVLAPFHKFLVPYQGFFGFPSI